MAEILQQYPVWLYVLVGLITPFKTLIGFSCGGILIYLLCCIFNAINNETDYDERKITNEIVACAVLFIFVIIMIITPSTELIYKYLATSLVNPEGLTIEEYAESIRILTNYMIKLYKWWYKNQNENWLKNFLALASRIYNKGHFYRRRDNEIL